MLSAFLNPNQDASVALAATMLAFDPASKFFNDESLLALAKEHLLVAIALQQPDGKIPEAQPNMDQLDSRYAGWTLFQVYWANRYWKLAEIEAALRKATLWLDDLTKNNLSIRYSPSVYTGPVPDKAELNYRLPRLYEYGTEFKTALAQLKELYATPDKFEDFVDGLAGAPYLSTLLGIPRTAYRLDQ